MKNRMIPLVKQIYFNLIGCSSSRAIHISLRNEVVNFIKQYKAKNPIVIKNSEGKKVNLHLPYKKMFEGEKVAFLALCSDYIWLEEKDE